MHDNHLHPSDAQAKPSTSPGTVERRPHAAATTSSRSRMSIFVMDNDSVRQPSVTSSRRQETVKKYTIDDFNFLKVLGKGSFGKVRLSASVNNLSSLLVIVVCVISSKDAQGSSPC